MIRVDNFFIAKYHGSIAIRPDNLRSNFDSYSRTRLFFYSFDFFFFSPIFTSRGARGDLIFHRRRETRGTRRIMYTENQQNSSNRIDITFNHHALYRESIKRVELVCGNVLTTLWNKPARQKLLQFCKYRQVL